MLKNLTLRNFVLFEEQKIDFQNNINALVGNTGAGKSVIFSAINVLCGQRNIKKYIMKDKDFYELEAVIDLSQISKQVFLKISEIVSIDDSLELKIYRKLTKNSKSVIKINDKEYNLQDLKKIMDNLIEIHFQNSTDEILKEENQINILDSLIDFTLLESYSTLYKQYVEQRKKVKTLNEEDQNKEQIMELLNFQIDKLAKIQNIENEEILEKQKIEYENIDKIRQVDKEVLEKINIIYIELGNLRNILEQNEKYGYEEYLDNVNNLYYEMESLSFEHSKKETQFFDINIDEVIDKLSQLRSLKRKYNLDYENLMLKYEQLLEQKDHLNNLSKTIIVEEKKLKEIEENLQNIASDISQKRKEAAKQLEQKINDNFVNLDMVHAKLNIKVCTVALNELGMDEVEFLIRTNKGHDMQNIMSIASGGEKSRIILIFKIVMNDFKNKKIFLLDEIDQGVSAQVAKNVGLRLKQFAKDKQVIIISHTVQVISLSDHLYEVKKDDKKDISMSRVEKLGQKEKENFIASYLEI